MEIIELAAISGGHTLDYQLMPWSRALVEVRSGNITGVVGVEEGDHEGLVFSDKMGDDSICFFVNQGDTFKFTGIADMAKLQSVGSAQGYVYPDEFMNWQKANPTKVQSVSGDNTLELNTKKVKGHRIQAFVENASVVDHARKSIPELKGVVSAGCLANADLFAGVSAKNPKSAEIVKAINAKLTELKKSGELKKILSKYGMTPW